MKYGIINNYTGEISYPYQSSIVISDACPDDDIVYLCSSTSDPADIYSTKNFISNNTYSFKTNLVYKSSNVQYTLQGTARQINLKQVYSKGSKIQYTLQGTARQINLKQVYSKGITLQYINEKNNYSTQINNNWLHKTSINLQSNKGSVSRQVQIKNSVIVNLQKIHFKSKKVKARLTWLLRVPIEKNIYSYKKSYNVKKINNKKIDILGYYYNKSAEVFYNSGQIAKQLSTMNSDYIDFLTGSIIFDYSSGPTLGSEKIINLQKTIEEENLLFSERWINRAKENDNNNYYYWSTKKEDILKADKIVKEDTKEFISVAYKQE